MREFRQRAETKDEKMIFHFHTEIERAKKEKFHFDFFFVFNSFLSLFIFSFADDTKDFHTHEEHFESF